MRLPHPPESAVAGKNPSNVWMLRKVTVDSWIRNTRDDRTDSVQDVPVDPVQSTVRRNVPLACRECSASGR